MVGDEGSFLIYESFFLVFALVELKVAGVEFLLFEVLEYLVWDRIGNVTFVP